MLYTCDVAGGPGHHVNDGPTHEAQENRNHRSVHLTSGCLSLVDNICLFVCWWGKEGLGECESVCVCLPVVMMKK